MTVNKLQLPAKQNAVQQKINEIIDNLGGGGATDVQINSTSITSQGVANIVTNSAYDASSNKIATMSDLPDSEIFVATYGTTTFNEIKTAITNGKIVLAKLDSLYYNLTFIDTSVVFQFSRVCQDICYMVQVISTNSWSNENYIYQKTSTAVTHTASTAVGSSTTPVYIASNGKATSTGLSIASSRFDGQWVGKKYDWSANTAVGSYSYNLSNYLPSDYSTTPYLVYGYLYGGKDSSSGGSIGAVGRVASPYSNASTDNAFAVYIACIANSRRAVISFILPVGKQGSTLYDKVYSQISDGAMSFFHVFLCGYRRMGTNG